MQELGTLFRICLRAKRLLNLGRPALSNRRSRNGQERKVNSTNKIANLTFTAVQNALRGLVANRYAARSAIPRMFYSHTGLRTPKEVAMRLAESFCQSGFAQFVNSPAGRIARIIAGLALIGWGYAQGAGAAGIILIVVGLVPLAAGVFHLCLISALLGGPISGARIAKSKPQS